MRLWCAFSFSFQTLTVTSASHVIKRDYLLYTRNLHVLWALQFLCQISLELVNIISILMQLLPPNLAYKLASPVLIIHQWASFAEPLLIALHCILVLKTYQLSCLLLHLRSEKKLTKNWWTSNRTFQIPFDRNAINAREEEPNACPHQFLEATIQAHLSDAPTFHDF